MRVGAREGKGEKDDWEPNNKLRGNIFINNLITSSPSPHSLSSYLWPPTLQHTHTTLTIHYTSSSTTKLSFHPSTTISTKSFPQEERRSFFFFSYTIFFLFFSLYLSIFLSVFLLINFFTAFSLRYFLF